jgi:hypothetical protein
MTENLPLEKKLNDYLSQKLCCFTKMIFLQDTGQIHVSIYR